jgi:hypothetical protein
MHPIDRALMLLALSGHPADDLADLPLAERNMRLIALRGAMYGRTQTMLCDCPRCGDTQEIDLPLDDLQEALATAPPPLETITVEGTEVQLRALTSRDLSRIAHERDANRAATILLSSATSTTTNALTAPETPERNRAKVRARIEAREEAAFIRLSFACSACGHGWSEIFDPGEALFSEVSADAGRLIRQIVTLAERFGWSEAEILALPTERRATYLAAETLR